LSVFQAVLEDGKTFSGSPIPVENIVIIASAVVRDLLNDPKDSKQIEDLFFGQRTRQKDIKTPPADIDKPMIQLPSNLKPTSSLISLSTITSLLGDDVYSIMDEECGKRIYSLVSCETPEKIVEEVDPLTQLFTIKGVLASK
jgi:hypothetical protein